ncbi:MAG: NADH:ubiquinone reductase (Na(+)-transporting) subunit C [Bacteroidales bacterium]
MKDFSNRYIFIFSVAMVTVVAALLSAAAMLLQPLQERNREIEKKRNILASVKIEATRSDAVELYDRIIKNSFVINTDGDVVDNVNPFTVDLRSEQRKPLDQQSLPIFIANPRDAIEVIIIPLEGRGLWGPIFGYISLESDMSTVYGVSFNHTGETPGLGAEINTTWFGDLFNGKKIFAGERFVSIKVVKGGARDDNPHAVDAISGGTITSTGLEEMLYDCLVKYEKYFIKHKL